MSKDLDTFIDEVVTTLASVAGVKVSGEASDNLAHWPAAPVWSARGSVEMAIGQVADWRHEVRVGLLGPRQDVKRMGAILLPLLEPLVEALTSKMVNQQFTSIESFGSIDYVYGPIDWGGVGLFGFVLTIHDVAIRRVIT